MSNRLSRIYTGSGDAGKTSLGNGHKVAKTSQRITTLGEVDELNALLGVVITLLAPEDELTALLQLCQHQLFDLGGELAVASAEYQQITEQHCEELEQLIDKLNQQLPPLKEFILPGGNPAAAHCHHARTVCRRAERQLWALADVEAVHAAGTIYLNRLSDLLFVIARILARRDGNEILWQPASKRLTL